MARMIQEELQTDQRPHLDLYSSAYAHFFLFRYPMNLSTPSETRLGRLEREPLAHERSGQYRSPEQAGVPHREEEEEEDDDEEEESEA